MVFLSLGVLRLGKIVRFIPYPVVGGFLAGTGWLLVQGALSVLTSVNLTFEKLPALTAPGAPIQWLPALAFGVGITLLLRRYNHFLLLPGVIAFGVVCFYGICWVSGISVAEAEKAGFLLGPFPSGGLWPSFTIADLDRVDWVVLKSCTGNFFAVAALSAISTLLNASGLELATEQEIDLDRELRGTGLANVITGAMGGVVGYLSLSESTLNYKIGARSRAAGLVCALCSAITLVLGGSALSYFPKPVLGGVLLFLGFSFLVETLYDAWFQLPRIEYALVILILSVVVMVGFLEGIGVGIVISSFLFAVNYARIDVVRNAISGAVLRSKAARSSAAESSLTQMGNRIYILQLQGYIFFGTAYSLLKQVQRRLLTDDPAQVSYIILDFRHVKGIDASAIVAFTRMRKLVEGYNVTLTLTELAPAVRKQLTRGGCIDEPEPSDGATAPAATEDSVIKIFSDLDHGLEWCEDELLRTHTRSERDSTLIRLEFDTNIRHRDLVSRIMVYLETLEVPENFELFYQGDESNDLYLIESGELEAWDRARGRSPPAPPDHGAGQRGRGGCPVCRRGPVRIGAQHAPDRAPAPHDAGPRADVRRGIRPSPRRFTNSWRSSWPSAW